MLVVLALSGCGGGSGTTYTPAPESTRHVIRDTPQGRPGNPAVFERIEAESDCAKLQGEFDTAEANHKSAEPGSPAALAATEYMKAADERMQEVGCY